MGLSMKDWMEAYRYATKDEHCFLYLNFQAPRKLRIMKGFNEYLMIK